MLTQKIIVSRKTPLNQMSAKTKTPVKKNIDPMPSEGDWKSPTFQPPITTSTPKIPKVEMDIQPPLRKTSTRMVCPHCECLIWTRVETKPSLWAWIAGIALFCVGCVLCSCIPCCLESFEETTHFCPKCNVFLGSFKPKLL